jgi:hypothetical protein
LSVTPPIISRHTVPAKPDGLWTLIHPFIDGPVLLRIEASDDRWGYAPGRDAFCGADGDACALVARTLCLHQTAAVGALIGKIGGSSAGTCDGQLFVVGKRCVVRIDDGGPLYMTINDTVDGMSNNVGYMGIASLSFAPAPPKPAPAAPDPPAPKQPAAHDPHASALLRTPTVFGPRPPDGT